MQFPNMFFVDVDKGPATQTLNPLFVGDALANRIGVYLYKDGEPFSPGGSAFGRAVLSGGETVPIQNGVVSGNQLYIDLPSGVYAEQGPVKISVSWTDGTTTTTVLEGTGNVRLTETGTIIDPGTIISDVTALIQAIDSAVDSIPPDYTDLLESLAPIFSESVNYTAGQHVWYDGTLYRFTENHSAGSWTGADAAADTLSSTDSTLQVAGKAADAKATGDAISVAGSNALLRGVAPDYVSSVNGNYCRRSDLTLSGKYINTNTGRISTSAGYTAGYVKIPFPGTFVMTSLKRLFGATNRLFVPLFDGSKTFVKYLTGTSLNDHYIKFDVTEADLAKAVYLGITEEDAFAVKAVVLAASALPGLMDFSDPRFAAYRSDDGYSAANAADYCKSLLSLSVNLFNKDSAMNVTGRYHSRTGVTLAPGETNGSNYIESHPIFVTPGEYKFTSSYSTFAASAAVVAVTDAYGNIDHYLYGSDDHSVVTLTVPSVCFVSFNVAPGALATAMFTKSAAWPSSYIAFQRKLDGSLLDVAKEQTDFFTKTVSPNLIDLTGAISDKYFAPSTGSLNSKSGVTSVYVRLDGAGTYMTQSSKNIYGENQSKMIALFDAEKTYLATVTGTLGSYTNNKRVPLTFEVTAENISSGAVYFGLTMHTEYTDEIMAVKGTTYPDRWYPFGVSWGIPDLRLDGGQAPAYVQSPLWWKEAVYDGDSICASSTDVSHDGAWAERIAKLFMMKFQNYAVGGGTLTNKVYNSDGGAKHWVSANVETMAQQHPDADFIIFEGGTNDADLLGSILNGNVPARFGSYTDDDFSGNFDDETFCGAVESIIFKAIHYWPRSKIGFIIAPKMASNALQVDNPMRNRRAYFQTIMNICTKWGIPYLNLWDECQMNPKLLAHWDPEMTGAENRAAHKMYNDGQHPTPDGYVYITEMVKKWMERI